MMQLILYSFCFSELFTCEFCSNVQGLHVVCYYDAADLGNEDYDIPMSLYIVLYVLDV